MKIINEVLNEKINLKEILENNRIGMSTEEIIELYEDGSRYYHNFSHIKNMLESIEIYDESLIIAILFHDIIYDVRSQKNEEDSAEFFEKHYFGEDKEFAERVKDIILVTANKVEAKNQLEKEMLRVDRDILFSKDMDKLLKWERGIRKEYQSYSKEDYIKGRIVFLEEAMKETGNEILKELIEKVRRNNMD